MCTVPGSFGKRIDPVTVGTGVHDFHPISLAYVAGPWRVPLEFSLNYSDSNAWRDAIDEGRVTGAPMLDSSYVGGGWSTTLQESIVAMYADLQSNPRLSPNRFPWTANPCSTNERRADGSYTYKLLYRHPSGRTDEFGFLQSGSATGAEHCRVEGNDLVLSTRRSVPFRLRVVQYLTSASRQFQLTDLRTGIVTTFDAHGRILSKKAPTPSGAWFGWSVVYSAPGVGGRIRAERIVHDAGHEIVLSYKVPPADVRLPDELQTVSLRLGSTGAQTELARLNWNADTSTWLTSRWANNQLDRIHVSTLGRGWLFEYTGTVIAPNGNRTLLQRRMTKATNPVGAVVFEGSFAPMYPGSVQALAGRANIVADADSSYEFRRLGYSQVQNVNGSGVATRLANPCSTVSAPSSVSILDRRQRQLDVSGNPVVCSSDANCATGFLCAELPFGVAPSASRQCVRYSCQTATQATRPDEPGSFSEPGCVSCGSTTQLDWVDIPSAGATHALRRIKSKTSVTGVRTSYEHDDQGRVIAECENDSNGVVSRADPSSCPSTGQWQAWWYEDTGVAPWAVHEHQSRSVRGSSYAPYSKVWTHNTTTGLLTQVTETGWTYSESTWNWAQQTRTTTYSYTSSPHDGWTAVTGPSTRSETINYHAVSAGDANSGQVLHRWRSRNHPTLGALTPLSTVTTTYSLYGAPGYETDESGVTTTRTFDSAGRVRTSTTPLGTTRTAYDDKGRLLSIRAPSGQATVFEYDGASERPSRTIVTDTPALNLASEAVSASDGAVSSSSVDPYDLHPETTDRWRFSNVAGLTLRSSRQHLDDRGRTASIENTVTGARTTFTYDSVTGRLWRVQDPAGRITQYQRDAQGRVYQVIRDQSGSAVTTTYAYAGTSVVAAQVTQPNGQVLQYDYDDWGALVRSSATDMGTTVTTFDAAGRRTHQLESNGTHTVWLYDAADRVVNIDYDADHSWINGGDRGFWYDALPSAVSCPSGSTCGNLLGRLAYVENHATDPYTYRTYYGYTTAGLLQHENIAIGGLATNTVYTYDTYGRRTHMTFPFGTGDGVGYGYGGANGSADEQHVTSINWDINGGSVRPIVERIDRMPNGPISNMWYRQRASGALPASASVERNWAVNGTPSTVRWRSGLNTSANLADWTYSYDSNGLIAGLANAANAADTVNYRYDALDRLDCATQGSTSTTCAAGDPAAIATYTSDAAGNRTAAWDRYSNFSRTWSYPANSNRAQNWRRTIWSPGDHVAWNWGGAGGTSPGQRVSETISGFTRSYAYWPTGEVASVAVSDTRGYAYYTSANDHRGRRMFTRTTAPSGTVTESWFVYDDEDKLIGVRHYSGGTVRDEMLFYADGEPVFRMALDNGWSEVDRSFLYSDHLGTPRIGVSVDGSMASPTVTYRAPREPFMASAPVQQNAVPVRLRFPGQWEDVETQFTLWNGDQLSTPLLGNHARTMDPSAGAYTAVEPMWSGGDFGWGALALVAFSYAAVDPVQHWDPTGASPRWSRWRRLLELLSPADVAQPIAPRSCGTAPGSTWPSEMCPLTGSGACDGRTIRCNYACEGGPKCEREFSCSRRGEMNCPSSAWCS